MDNYFGGYLDGIKGRRKFEATSAAYKAGYKDGRSDRARGHGLREDNTKG